MVDAARARKLADRIKVVVAETLEMRVKDPRLGFITITDARVTGDLQQATVFYTVFGDDAEQADTAAALESAKGVLRSEVGKQTGVRHTPSLTFVADAVPETAAHIEDLLAKVAAADAEVHRAAAGATYAGEPDPYKAPRVESTRTTRSTMSARSTGTTRRHEHVRRPRRRRQAGRPRPRTTSWRGPGGWRAPAGSATPAPSTRWPPVSSCSGSTGRPGCSGHLTLTEKAYDATIRLGATHGHRRRRGRGRRDGGRLRCDRRRPAVGHRPADGRHRAGPVGGQRGQGRRQARLQAGAGGRGRRARRRVRSPCARFDVLASRPDGTCPRRRRPRRVLERHLRPGAGPRPRRRTRRGWAPHRTAPHPRRPVRPRRRAHARRARRGPRRPAADRRRCPVCLPGPRRRRRRGGSHLPRRPAARDRRPTARWPSSVRTARSSPSSRTAATPPRRSPSSSDRRGHEAGAAWGATGALCNQMVDKRLGGP